MPRIVGIDHLVLSVGDFGRSKSFYNKLLTFLGFKLKHEYDDMAGWSNGKTLFWIAAADTEGRRHKYRKGDIYFTDPDGMKLEAMIWAPPEKPSAKKRRSTPQRKSKKKSKR